MFDKYDILYGIKEGQKKEIKMETWATILILSIQVLLTGRINLVFGWPKDIVGTFDFITTSLLVGVFATFAKSYFGILKAIKRFQQKKNMLLILEDDSYSQEQIETVKKRAMVRSEILNILSMDGLSKDTRKRISKIQKRVGGIREAKAKANYLNSLQRKFFAGERLDKREIQYLNELVLSEKDLHLYQTISKALKLEQKNRKSA